MQARKLNKILCYDWLPEQAIWSYLALSWLPAVPRKRNFPQSHIKKSFIDLASLVFLREFMDPVEKQPKKGLAVYFVSSYTFFCISKYIPIKQTIATYR